VIQQAGGLLGGAAEVIGPQQDVLHLQFAIRVGDRYS
jgi:hypothetical protein